MKINKILFLLIFTMFCSSAFAQTEPKPFKHLRVGVGGGIGAEQTKISGVVFVEPSWRIRNFAFGLRVENLFRNNTGMTDQNLIQSWSVNSQYYILQGDLRLYAGLGAGIFTSENTYDGLCDCSTKTDGGQFGMYPRFGAEYGHLNIIFEYNVMREAEVTTRSIGLSPAYNLYAPSLRHVNTNYISMKVGVRLGGGAQ